MFWSRRKHRDQDLERELRSHLDLEAGEQIDPPKRRATCHGAAKVECALNAPQQTICCYPALFPKRVSAKLGRFFPQYVSHFPKVLCALLPIRVSDWTEIALVRGKRISQILIADRNLLFRRGLRSLLSAESDFRIVDEASDATETLAKVRLTSPDVLVIDLSLIEEAGQQTAFALRHAQPEMAILFLTQTDSAEQLDVAVAAGGRGYMLKNSAPAHLVAGIRQVAFADDQNNRGLSRIVPDLRALSDSNESYSRTTTLTPREQEVARLLAEGRTVREVSSELALSVKTVEAHKLNLMRKLDIHNRASLVEYAVQKGLVPAQLVR
jgi:two-component system response regulator NreC